MDAKAIRYQLGEIPGHEPNDTLTPSGVEFLHVRARETRLDESMQARDSTPNRYLNAIAGIKDPAPGNLLAAVLLVDVRVEGANSLGTA